MCCCGLRIEQQENSWNRHNMNNQRTIVDGNLSILLCRLVWCTICNYRWRSTMTRVSFISHKLRNNSAWVEGKDRICTMWWGRAWQNWWKYRKKKSYNFKIIDRLNENWNRMEWFFLFKNAFYTFVVIPSTRMSFVWYDNSSYSHFSHHFHRWI